MPGIWHYVCCCVGNPCDACPDPGNTPSTITATISGISLCCYKGFGSEDFKVVGDPNQTVEMTQEPDPCLWAGVIPNCTALSYMDDTCTDPTLEEFQVIVDVLLTPALDIIIRVYVDDPASAFPLLYYAENVLETCLTWPTTTNSLADCSALGTAGYGGGISLEAIL